MGRERGMREGEELGMTRVERREHIWLVCIIEDTPGGRRTLGQ